MNVNAHIHITSTDTTPPTLMSLHQTSNAAGLTLISFLGKGQRTGNTSSYRTATYQLEGQSPWPETQYLGKALAQHLQGIEKLVLLGTASSMWDVFGLDMAGEDETGFAVLAELETAVNEGRVTQAMLDTLAPILSQRMGCAVVLRLIGFARTAAEQTVLLHALAQDVPPNSRIVLDVTHGFRHLPMIGLVAARYLKHVRDAKVEAMYYGALDMSSNGITPVLNLNGMLKMLDWVDALSIYQHTGDYGPFAMLMKDAGMPTDKAQQWQHAAFHERTMSTEMAFSKLNDARQAMNELSDPLLDLFKPELNQRMSWARQPSRARRERALAEGYLKRHDHLRGVFYLFECIITAELERRPDLYAKPYTFNDRKEAKEQLKQRHHPTFPKLEWLRNNLAHGERSNNEHVHRALRSPKDMEKMLNELRQGLKDALPEI